MNCLARLGLMPYNDFIIQPKPSFRLSKSFNSEGVFCVYDRPGFRKGENHVDRKERFSEIS